MDLVVQGVCGLSYLFLRGLEELDWVIGHMLQIRSAVSPRAFMSMVGLRRLSCSEPTEMLNFLDWTCRAMRMHRTLKSSFEQSLLLLLPSFRLSSVLMVVVICVRRS